MPAFELERAQNNALERAQDHILERGILQRVSEYIPAAAGNLFLVTTTDVWRLHGGSIERQFEPNKLEVLFFAGGEVNKRLASIEQLAEQMAVKGADRTSLVIGFGGGIVTDVSGFLAATFMRGVRILQIPTTLLAQVDAAIGGKTGVNLVSGKNLIGSFHQPLRVLIDPDVLATLPDREYRAGLFEVIKYGVIRDPALFNLLNQRASEVLSRQPDVVDELIAASVRIKAEIVSQDEREHDLRRILNFGHTVGHALEAETEYARFLHGEAVAWGMLVATRLAELLGMFETENAQRVKSTICRFGPLPSAKDLNPDRIAKRLSGDKKTLQGQVHFVLPAHIGAVEIVSGVDVAMIRRAITDSLT